MYCMIKLKPLTWYHVLSRPRWPQFWIKMARGKELSHFERLFIFVVHWQQELQLQSLLSWLCFNRTSDIINWIYGKDSKQGGTLNMKAHIQNLWCLSISEICKGKAEERLFFRWLTMSMQWDQTVSKNHSYIERHIIEGMQCTNP